MSILYIRDKEGDLAPVKTIQGHTPVKGTDYYTAADKQAMKSEIVAAIITQEAGESESLVMSQKAVTDLVADALGTSGTTAYETVESVEEMTDTGKSYVLSSTGTIWANGEFTEEQEAENKFIASAATLNTRHGTTSTSAANGYFVTDYIAVEKFTESDPYIMRIFKSENVGFESSLLNSNARIHYFDANKTLLGDKYLRAAPASTKMSAPQTDANGNIYFHIDEQLETNGGSSFVEITDFDHSQVAYIRVTLAMNEDSAAITADDIADVIITFDADAVTVTAYKWYDTGLSPSEGGGGNYVDLLTKVNENKTDIAELDRRVISLETDTDILTVPSFWQNAVTACIEKIKALQVGRSCVTFPFFSDNHQRNGYAGMLIAHIMKQCHIPYAFFGGDSIDSGYIASEAVMIEQDRKFDLMMSYVPNGRFCRAVGNHDGYWAVDASNKNYYTDAQNYELFLREESIAQNKHFGGDGTYYYVDDIASKVRWIVLDTNDNTVEDEQISWLQNTALSFAESGWAVVFISHQPISNHYHANISNAAQVRQIVSGSGADVIGWFSGHIHRDRIYTGAAVNTTDDSEGDVMPFKQVTITSDHTGIAYDDATKHTVAEDDQSHAIDFVTVDRTARTVSLTRLGIGSDRSYTY